MQPQDRNAQVQLGEWRDWLLAKMLQKPKGPNLLGIEAGSNPDEILFRTKGGPVVAKVSATSRFVCLNLADKTYNFPKEPKSSS